LRTTAKHSQQAKHNNQQTSYPKSTPPINFGAMHSFFFSLPALHHRKTMAKQNKTQKTKHFGIFLA
jgi:hypothetical protein